METFSAHPAIDLATDLYYHLVDAGPLERAWSKVAPVAASVEAPAADVDQRIEENVSMNGTDSQGAAFETWMSANPWNRGRGSGETDLRAAVREAMAGSRLAKSRLAGGNCLRTIAKASGGRTQAAMRMDKRHRTEAAIVA